MLPRCSSAAARPSDSGETSSHHPRPGPGCASTTIQARAARMIIRAIMYQKLAWVGKRYRKWGGAGARHPTVRSEDLANHQNRNRKAEGSWESGTIRRDDLGACAAITVTTFKPKTLRPIAAKKPTYPKEGVEPPFPAFGFKRPEQKG
jgi:hypothetical protein